jgi:NADH-quinone oxidoreductase subunit E
MFKINQDITDIISQYPHKRSAIMPLLYVVQEQEGWVSNEAIEHIAKILEIPPIWVYEVVSFYTMYITKQHDKPVIHVCRTLSCWLKGADEIVQECTKYNVDIKSVECLGACIYAPVISINNQYYEDMSIEKLPQVLENICKNNKDTKHVDDEA